MSDTTGRVLRLLGLLQSRALWTSEELAGRLGVTTRSVRRDVERLRALGYPVRASRGVGGGYQLGRGGALPPLLLDPDEAVAVAVSLRLAAGGSVSGVQESALRALTKLDQVLPVALRSEVAALAAATVTVDRSAPTVDPQLLLPLSRACRDHVQARFGYAARDGSLSQRRVEPYHLVAMGGRWYLLAYDLEREDWRSFRLDRVDGPSLRSSTWRFTPRAAPDAAEYVRHAVTRAPYRHVITVEVDLEASELTERMPPNSGDITPVDAGRSRLVTGHESVDAILGDLLMLDAPLRVIDPPEARERAALLARRLSPES